MSCYTVLFVSRMERNLSEAYSTRTYEWRDKCMLCKAVMGEQKKGNCSRPIAGMILGHNLAG